MIILGIETSCDETAAAIVEDGTKILSNIVASSLKLHTKTGGIIPEVAAREQIKYIIPIINQTLEEAFPKTLHSTPYAIRHIDALAVTVGPGLIGSLLVGVETAKTLAYLWQKPIVPVNHLVAHLYANFLPIPNSQFLIPKFPAIGLIASGGHTDLLLMKGHGKFLWLGGTRDDAAGEAFDKIARLLGLDYPGGPAIAAEAAESGIKKTRSKIATPAPRDHELKIKLPRPMMEEENFSSKGRPAFGWDFSFSGLKTAVLREVNKLKVLKQWHNETMKQFAFEVQEAITDVLVVKTLRAAEKYKVKTILLGGGVTANQRLHDKFSLKIKNLKFKIKLFVPPKSLCTDNAAVIASSAYFNCKPVSWEKITANPDLYF